MSPKASIASANPSQIDKDNSAMTADGETPWRVAKWIARSGLCSRREAEAWVLAGRVSLDGVRLETPAATAERASQITVDGRPLPEPEGPKLWRFHKPRGLLTTTKDPEGRPTVFQRIRDQLGELPHMMPVGRLDMNSEGLLLLTNDGALKRRLELPQSGWLRRYRVRVFGRVSEERLAELAKGVTVEGIAYGPIEARLDEQRGANAWLTMGLREGKNREIRKVCEHLGWQVNRLIRVAYGPFTLGKLPRGQITPVPRGQLAEVLGEKPKTTEKVGTAKAKPRPTKPGGRKPFSGKPRARKTGPARQGAASPTRKKSDADRRR